LEQHLSSAPTNVSQSFRRSSTASQLNPKKVRQHLI
jgi:hypothetical protein